MIKILLYKNGEKQNVNKNRSVDIVAILNKGHNCIEIIKNKFYKTGFYSYGMFTYFMLWLMEKYSTSPENYTPFVNCFHKEIKSLDSMERDKLIIIANKLTEFINEI